MCAAEVGGGGAESGGQGQVEHTLDRGEALLLLHVLEAAKGCEQSSNLSLFISLSLSLSTSARALSLSLSLSVRSLLSPLALSFHFPWLSISHPMRR